MTPFQPRILKHLAAASVLLLLGAGAPAAQAQHPETFADAQRIYAPAGCCELCNYRVTHWGTLSGRWTKDCLATVQTWWERVPSCSSCDENEDLAARAQVRRHHRVANGAAPAAVVMDMDLEMDLGPAFASAADLPMVDGEDPYAHSHGGYRSLSVEGTGACDLESEGHPSEDPLPSLVLSGSPGRLPRTTLFRTPQLAPKRPVPSHTL